MKKYLAVVLISMMPQAGILAQSAPATPTATITVPNCAEAQCAFKTSIAVQGALFSAAALPSTPANALRQADATRLYVAHLQETGYTAAAERTLRANPAMIFTPISPAQLSRVYGNSQFVRGGPVTSYDEFARFMMLTPLQREEASRYFNKVGVAGIQRDVVAAMYTRAYAMKGVTAPTSVVFLLNARTQGEQRVCDIYATAAAISTVTGDEIGAFGFFLIWLGSGCSN